MKITVRRGAFPADDLQPFLKHGETLADLSRGLEQSASAESLRGSRRTWAGSLERDETGNDRSERGPGMYHRSQSCIDAAVQYPSLRAQSVKVPGGRSRVEFFLGEGRGARSSVGSTDDEGFEDGRTDLTGSWEASHVPSAAVEFAQAGSSEAARMVNSFRESLKLRQTLDPGSTDEDDKYEYPVPSVASDISEPSVYQSLLPRPASPTPVQQNPLYATHIPCARREVPPAGWRASKKDVYENFPREDLPVLLAPATKRPEKRVKNERIINLVNICNVFDPKQHFLLTQAIFQE